MADAASSPAFETASPGSPGPPTASSSAAAPESGLMSASFSGLLATQFFTALNDNIFRWLVIGVGKEFVDRSQAHSVLMAGTVGFVAPYLLLAAPAGYLADRFSKRSVIVWCKFAEIIVMALGLLAIYAQNLPLLMVVVALMGAQSALFAPAKIGAIPETLRSSQISAANGLFGLATVVSCTIGMALGSWLADEIRRQFLWGWGLAAGALLGVALIGWLGSLLITSLPAGNPAAPFPWNPLRQTLRDIGALASRRALLRVALGTVFFWSVGALAQLNIDQFAAEGGGLEQSAKTPLLLSLVVGMGLGSVLAGALSRGRVELGLLPLGCLGLATCAAMLFTVEGVIIQPGTAVTAGFIWACVFLTGLGASAGLFDVPLEAYLQENSPPEQRGAVLAATNFLVFLGILAASGVFWVLRFPIYEGDLANVPARLRGAALAEADQQRVKTAASAFALEWRNASAAVVGDSTSNIAPSGVLPRLEDHLPEAGAAARAETLAQLLWIDFRERRARGLLIEREAYFRRFPRHTLLVDQVLQQSQPLPLFSARGVFLVVAAFTVPVLIYVVWLLPQATIRFAVWLLSLTVYRIHVLGREHLPARGGALLVCNHVSWLDGALLLLTSSRPVRVIVYAGNFERGWARRIAKFWGAILLPTKPKALAAALAEAREALRQGELVCIFPEGGITRTGQIQGFKPGLMKILEGVEAPVIPVYFDNLWGSIFSFERGRFFWKWPRQWPYPIYLHFGEPLLHTRDAHAARRAVQDLGASAVEKRMHLRTSLPRQFVRRCKQRRWRAKVADSSGAELTGGQLLARTLVLRRLLRRHTLAADETHVGVLLPPTNAAVATNMALALDRRVAVNLNYTTSSDTMNECCRQAGVRHVLTSRKFFEKLQERHPLSLTPELVFLEDFQTKPTWFDKLLAGAQAYVCPSRLVEWSLGLHRARGDDVLTLIFTSGSTGEPKGVMLTHANVASNVDAIDQVVRVNSQDVLIGVLPFFHSFGYTVTMWAVMSLDMQGVYHFNPTEARQVGKLCQRHKATILLSTPTFLRGFLRRCEKDELQTLDVVVAGAEKLPKSMSDAFEEKFGVRPVEGYGTTELSPLVSVNIPPSRAQGNFQDSLREGSVGRPVPGVSAKVLDPDSEQELPAGQSGMLWIKGPNVMKGYLNRPDLTSKVLRDGWYRTGDIALIDADGFLHITGRQSRFSKIGGEMVPHIQIEDALKKILAVKDDEPAKVFVTAVPDAARGERLVVVHTPLDKTPRELQHALGEAGLPNLFIPGADSYVEIAELPVLGSGKINEKEIQQIARRAFGEGA